VLQELTLQAAAGMKEIHSPDISLLSCPYVNLVSLQSQHTKYSVCSTLQVQTPPR
ncbi:hypothetical protein J6590_093187, partial [Homalodisca vitripennis]